MHPLPAEFTARLAEIAAADAAAKRAGGPWRLYLPIAPGCATLRLASSHPTKAAAEARLAPCFPAVRRFAEIRHEV